MAERNRLRFERLTKSYHKKPVLNDVSLVFLENAKIGVIGAKSARANAAVHHGPGQDKEYEGVAREPMASPSVTCPGASPARGQDRPRERRDRRRADPALVKQHQELSLKLGEDLSADAMDKVMAESPTASTRSS